MTTPFACWIAGGTSPGCVDLGRVERRHFGHVTPDEAAVRVEALRLRDRIEDPEVGLRIAARRRRPLPAAVVRRQVEVDQRVGEVPLAPAPVDEQVLHEERRRHHAQPVVHVPGGVQLPHRGVDERIAGGSVAPRGELRLVVRKREVRVLRLEARADDVRVVPEDLRVEVPPDEFGQPRRRAFAVGLERARVRERGEFADRHRAEAQVDRQVRRSLDGREVARCAIRVDARAKVRRERGAAGHAGHDAHRAQVGAREAHRLERRDRAADCGRRTRERAGVARDGIRLQVERRQRPQPRVLVRREHGKRLAGLRQHLVALEDHVVLARLERDAAVGEVVRDGGVAVARRRLVVVVRVDGVHAEVRRERADRVARGPWRTISAPPRARERPVELDDGVVDELDAPVVAPRQRIQDLAVEHEHAVDGARVLERGVQRRVIEVAQVAAEPDERAFVADVGCGHGGQERWRTVPTAWPARAFTGLARRYVAPGDSGRRTPSIAAGGPALHCGPPPKRLQFDEMGGSVNLTHHFLIAMPAMTDPHFAHTLTYVCEHNQDGALGIVVNKPIDMTLSALFEQIDVPLADAALRASPVHYGGPVQIDRGFVLHRPLGNWQSTLAISDDMGLTTSKDVLEAVGRGDGPEGRVRVAGLRGLVGRTARAGARAERVAHRRGRRRTSCSTFPRSAGCRRRCSCSASTSPGCPRTSGTRDA